nr:hypothetical protein [Candidatus Sigynarchaeota archaeon]
MKKRRDLTTFVAFLSIIATIAAISTTTRLLPKNDLIPGELGNSGVITTPVTINGNSNLAAFPGITGNGTTGNPYKIANTIFTNITGYMLTLLNIDAHLVLDNCTFVSYPGSLYSLVYLYNVKNLKVIDCNFTYTSNMAIYAPSIINTRIENTTFTQTTRCAYLYGTNVSLINNTARDCSHFCYMNNPIVNLTMDNNTAINCRAMLTVNAYSDVFINYSISLRNMLNGKPFLYIKNQANVTISNASQVFLINSTNARVEDMEFQGTSYSIIIYKSRNVTATNITFTGILDVPLSIWYSNITRVLNCTFTNASSSVILRYCNNFTLEN